jgi:hypothetical protein
MLSRDKRFIMTTAVLERDFMRLNLHVHVICARICCKVVVKMVKELKLSLAVETQKSEVLLARTLAVPVLQFPDRRTSVLHPQQSYRGRRSIHTDFFAVL